MRFGALTATSTLTTAHRQRACLYGSALLGLVLLAVRTARPPSQLAVPSGASLRTVTLRLDAAKQTPPILPTVDVPLTDDCCGAVALPRCPPLPAKAHILLFASVPNVASDTARRLPLRAQWAKSVAMMKRKLAARGAPAARVELRFVIGTEVMPADQLQAVSAEAAAQGDILLIDAPDKDAGQPRVRSATTLKVMHSMRYAVNNYVFDWFARIGDDAYFRVDYFAELALEHAYPKEWAYVGYKFANHVVRIRRENEGTASMWCRKSSPLAFFLAGPPHRLHPQLHRRHGLLADYDLAQFTCRSHRALYDGFPEDAVVGAWFVGTKVTIIHDPRFHDVDHVTTVAYAPCTNTSLLMHHMWTQDRWDGIDGDGLLQC